MALGMALAHHHVGLAGQSARAEIASTSGDRRLWGRDELIRLLRPQLPPLTWYAGWRLIPLSGGFSGANSVAQIGADHR
jgi:hypothetical protein